ncbi:hypothetical protein PPL_04502 [Heterostelium album PN500]|uniref:F-box domain-containing protein n=1 Tax=Heterostelium pallidum (strain ATCC 26659 / Pp 5 / PN500) TaxID=670386 RepID=D3B7R4_HETP5|nr:hypothetical protein PPL_04502 [Heterostelium album PN500]EFA82807.1 hypothetical protein PPL_04502 [Heterostelium album PN500]|eukprot:XP_020434924.1 hypothetical protein PPL_04502 [Heterostelium album PN500]
MSKPGLIPNALNTSIEWYFFIFAENWIDKVEPPTDYYVKEMQKSLTSFFGSSKILGTSSKPSGSSSDQEKSDTVKIVDIFVKIISDTLPVFTSNEFSFVDIVKITDSDQQRGNKRELQLIEDYNPDVSSTDANGSDEYAASSVETTLSTKKSKRSKEFHLNTPTDYFFDLPSENTMYLLPPFVPSKLLAFNTSASAPIVRVTEPKTDILCMPSEILNHILSFLSDVDLCRCARTCRHMKRLSERDSLWYCQYVRWFGKCCFKQSSLDSVLPPNIAMWDNYRKTTFPQSALDPPFKNPAQTYFLSKETMYESITGNWKKKFFLKIRMEALWALCRGDQPQNTGGDFGSGSEEGFTMMSICSYKISPQLFAVIPNNKDEYISAILLHHSYAFFSTNTGDFYKVNLWSPMESYDQVFTKLNIGQNQINQNHNEEIEQHHQQQQQTNETMITATTNNNMNNIPNQTNWPVKTFDLTPNRLICATSTKISYWDPRNLQSPIGELWSPLTTDVVNIQLSQFNVMVLYSNGISHVWDFRVVRVKFQQSFELQFVESKSVLNQQTIIVVQRLDISSIQSKDLPTLILKKTSTLMHSIAFHPPP